MQKILHIDLQEFNSLKELKEAFNEMDKEMAENGTALVSSKQEAEKTLKERTDLTRVFYFDICVFEGSNYYILCEALFD